MFRRALEEQSGVSESAAVSPAASAVSLRAADAVGGTSVSIAAAVAHTTFLYAYLRIHSLLTFISALFLFERTMQDTFRNRLSI